MRSVINLAGCFLFICPKASSSLLMLIDFFNISKSLYSFDKHRRFLRVKLFSFFSGDSPLCTSCDASPLRIEQMGLPRAGGPASDNYTKKDVRGCLIVCPVTSYADMVCALWLTCPPGVNTPAKGGQAYYIYGVTLRCPRERR